MKKLNYRGRYTIACSMFAAMALLGGLAGCAATRTGQAGDVVKTVWKVRDQYVAIEKQDQPGAAITANAHPADVSAERLRSILDSIAVQVPGKEKPVQLFNDPEIKLLSEKIKEALASAGPDEDVTFATIGHYPTLLGVFHERKVTTGRVFSHAGQLNIIFGDVLREVKDNEDRRLYPFLRGSRSAAAPGEWRLTPNQGGEGFTAKRSDWIVFPLAGPATPAVAPGTGSDTGSTGISGKAAAPVPPGKPDTAVKKTPEERLRTLNDLRQKNLIDEEEYQTKRREILNEL